jgi:hypothetical protein
MLIEKIYKRPILIGIVVAAIVHSVAILIRELSPVAALAPIIDAIAFNGSWVYLISILIAIILSAKQVKQFFICIPQRVLAKTTESLGIFLAYEFIVLFLLLIVFPAVAYFYSGVHIYFKHQHPQWHHFFDYLPFTDLFNRALTSFPFFITLFAMVSLLCVTMPHTYLSYKYAKKSVAPLRSAITFSILLSVGITAIIMVLLAMSIAPWMILILFLVGPVVLFSYIIVNIVMLRYHNKYIECS